MSESKITVFNNYVLNKELNFYDKFDDEDLNLDDTTLNAVYSYGYEKLSPIQRIALKPIIDGNDVLLQSHAGSGKTATFIIGMLGCINEDLEETQCIIMGNTRELATQIHDVFKNLSKYKNISSYLCIGGNMDNKYTTDVKKDQVIIGTPGRLADLLSKNIIDISGLKMLIVDEADDILSNSFRAQIKKIFSYVQKSTQVILSSATIPEEMVGLVKCILREDYVSIRVKDDELKLDGIEQFYVYLNEEDKVDTLIDLYSHLSIGQAIVYINKVSRADEVKSILESKNFSVDVLHGELLQKERKEIMNNFRIGNSRILLTTDVLSRGIDIQQISLVINFDMPKYSQTYIHRIGRSGRYGRNGVAINFITKFDKNIVSNIEKSYNTKISQLNNDTISNLL